MLTCPPLGPRDDDSDEPVSPPADWSGDPFDLLPPAYELSEEERDLATRYRNNDISGGYVRSQIAAFRAPQPAEKHERRRSCLLQIRQLVDGGPWVLPSSFVKLCQDDDLIDRIRHNNLWLYPTPILISLDDVDGDVALQIVNEGQGCCYFSLLLHGNGDHCVIYHEDPLVHYWEAPPVPASNVKNILIYRCAATFDEWLAVYFLDCRRHDANYDAMLARFLGQ